MEKPLTHQRRLEIPFTEMGCALIRGYMFVLVPEKSLCGCVGDFTIHSKMIPVQILEEEKNENPLILILKS